MLWGFGWYDNSAGGRLWVAGRIILVSAGAGGRMILVRGRRQMAGLY